MKTQMVSHYFLLKNPKLTGVFCADGELNFFEEMEVFHLDYFFLKEGKLYNAKGPSLIRSDKRTVFSINQIDSPSVVHEIVYDRPGRISALGKYIPDPKSSIVRQTYQKNDAYHRLDGPAYCDHLETFYCINGTEFKKEDWEKHPEVIEYQSKLNLKEKMNKVFNRGKDNE